MSGRLSLPLAMLAAGVTLLVAAGRDDAHATATESKGGVLRVARFDDVDFVDPALADGPSWELLHPTCARLFNNPDRPGEPGTRVVPEVVRRFAVSKDGRTYTFDLKRTFRFHTGAAVTARSFADAFDRDADPRMRSRAKNYMHEIVGADAVADGEAHTISGVRVLGPYRLQIRLTRPLGDLTARSTMIFFCPVLPGTPVDPHGMDNPAGSGPYYVAERIVNERIVLKRNPYYRGDRPANVDEIVYTVGLDPEECLAAVERNQIDLCLGPAALPDSAHRGLAAKYGVNRPDGRYFVAPVLSSFAFAFNHERPAFDGPGQIPLEKAINYALDRHALARVFGYLGGRRTDRMSPPASAHRGPLLHHRGGSRDGEEVVGVARQSPLHPSSTPSTPPSRRIRAGIRLRPEVDRHRRHGQVLRPRRNGAEEGGYPGEPFDVVFQPGWSTDADPPLSSRAAAPTARAWGRLGRATGRTRRSEGRHAHRRREPPTAKHVAGHGRKLDVDLMRNDRPWAPCSSICTMYLDPAVSPLLRRSVLS